MKTSKDKPCDCITDTISNTTCNKEMRCVEDTEIPFVFSNVHYLWFAQSPSHHCKIVRTLSQISPRDYSWLSTSSFFDHACLFLDPPCFCSKCQKLWLPWQRGYGCHIHRPSWRKPSGGSRRCGWKVVVFAMCCFPIASMYGIFPTFGWFVW